VAAAAQLGLDQTAVPDPATEEDSQHQRGGFKGMKTALHEALHTRRQAYMETVAKSQSEFKERLDCHVEEMQQRSEKMRNCFEENMRAEPILSPRSIPSPRAPQVDPEAYEAYLSDDKESWERCTRESTRWKEFEEKVKEEYHEEALQHAQQSSEKRRQEEEEQRTVTEVEEADRWERAKAKLGQLSEDRQRLAKQRDVEQQRRREAFEAKVEQQRFEFEAHKTRAWFAQEKERQEQEALRKIDREAEEVRWQEKIEAEQVWMKAKKEEKEKLACRRKARDEQERRDQVKKTAAAEKRFAEETQRRQRAEERLKEAKARQDRASREAAERIKREARKDTERDRLRREKDRKDREESERRKRTREQRPSSSRSVPDPRQFNRKPKATSRETPSTGTNAYSQYQWNWKSRTGTGPPPSQRPNSRFSGSSSQKPFTQRSNGYRAPIKKANMEEQWVTFEGKKGCIRSQDVPFPDKASIVIQAQQKDEYKKLALRWHPDKFQQNFGSRLDKTEEDKIMTLVKEVFQNINAARQSRSFSYMQTG